MPSSLPAQPLRLWSISRPRFWIYTLGPYVVGVLIGLPSLEAARDWRLAAFAAFWSWPANLWIYGVNDVYDFETDARNRKKAGYEHIVEQARQKQLLLWVWATVLPFVALACWSTNSWALAALGAFLLLSHGYSAPPVRAKARPLLDSMFNALYVFPAAFGYALAGGSSLWIPGTLAAWCWVMAMHAYSAVPDISADREARLATIATWLGLKGTILFCAALYLASAALSYPALTGLSLALGSLYTAMMLLSLRAGSEEGVLRLYKYFPLLNTLAGFCLFWRIALQKFGPHIQGFLKGL
jgi:4-hydroxybenzoate polyprenyltransferase